MTTYSGDDVARRQSSTQLTPMHVFQFSFEVAALLCLLYAVAFPVLLYLDTGVILLSDVSIYYALTALGLHLTERALELAEGVRR